eukprot:2883840-Rhodomonas_salina.1
MLGSSLAIWLCASESLVIEVQQRTEGGSLGMALCETSTTAMSQKSVNASGNSFSWKLVRFAACPADALAERQARVSSAQTVL